MKPRSELRVHELKTHPEPYRAVCAELKSHEIRVADRDFRAGDVLVLREYDPTQRLEDEEIRGYTGSWCSRVITYVSAPGTWGLPKTLCVLSIAPFPRLEELAP